MTVHPERRRSSEKESPPSPTAAAPVRSVLNSGDASGPAAPTPVPNANAEAVRRKIEQLQSLVDVSLYITSTLDLQKVLQRVLEVSTLVIHAEASSLLLAEGDELHFAVALGDNVESLRSLRIKVGQGVAGRVAQSGESCIINDVTAEPAFFPGIDQALGFETRTLLAVPLKVADSVIGVMEFVNKLPSTSQFNEEDLEICVAMANMVSVAIENARSFHQAITDRLTNLYNFGYYQERFPKELAMARRHNQPLSLVMVDIDNFKAYNDANGHDVGNQALIQVARLLNASCREGDIVARYGGEEFVVVLPSTAKREAGRFAERARSAVWGFEFPNAAGQPLGRLSISLGVATFPEDGDTDASLLHIADQSLYRAKAEGRNRTVVN